MIALCGGPVHQVLFSPSRDWKVAPLTVVLPPAPSTATLVTRPPHSPLPSRARTRTRATVPTPKAPFSADAETVVVQLWFGS